MRNLGSLWLAAAVALGCASVSAQNTPQDGAGAYATGTYRNLFAEDGHSQNEIHAKIEAAYQQLFHGDPQTQAIAVRCRQQRQRPADVCHRLGQSRCAH